MEATIVSPKQTCRIGTYRTTCWPCGGVTFEIEECENDGRGPFALCPVCSGRTTIWGGRTLAPPFSW
jgi:hypothetical protein